MDLETRISDIGSEMRSSLRAVLDSLPEGQQGPQGLAKALTLDKVLLSRVLKTARCTDPIGVAYHVPGPEPMRRFYRAARRRGVAPELTEAGERAVLAFQSLVREEVGDRSSLDTLISSWLPSAREEFELRRRQSAFKALSQLKGVSAQTSFGTVLLYPSADEAQLDVVWIQGLFGMRRWRPGARVKLASRRQVQNGRDRQPQTLDGRSVEGIEPLRLDRFYQAAPAEIEMRHVGDTVHYLLGGEGCGRKSAVDLLFAEVNLAEMPRVPEPGRRGYVFAEVGLPCHEILFDVLVHESVYPGVLPELEVYDTALDGIVNANDASRAVDRIETTAELQHMGRGTAKLRATEVPNHQQLLDHVFESRGQDAEEFRAYRCRLDYPLYGSQFVVAFGPPPALS